MPSKHILVCEDVLVLQSRLAAHFSTVFGHEGLVQISYVCGGNQARGVVEYSKVNLILLDHDMPDGNGPAFLKWLRTRSHDSYNCQIPVMTFSGISSNNDHLVSLGANILAAKQDVIAGLWDETIDSILFPKTEA